MIHGRGNGWEGEVARTHAALRTRDLLTSPFGWNGTIVPCGKLLVKEDFRRFLVAFWRLVADWVISAEYVNRGCETSFCARPSHGLANHLQRREYQPLAHACHVRKETVLDRVVLRTIRRIMGHADFTANAIRQMLQMVFEDMPIGRVAAAAVA